MFNLVVSEVWVHDYLALLLWTQDNRRHHGGSMRQWIPVHLLVPRKQKDKEERG